jgi:hypothetical protein
VPAFQVEATALSDVPRSNGHAELDVDELDDDAPLDADEAAAAMATALETTDETLDERVVAVVDELGDVGRVREGSAAVFRVGGVPFAVLAGAVLEVRLEAPVARAALRTADTTVSPRGDGWIAFAPATTDRFALDRAEAWIRSAHRLATAG